MAHPSYAITESLSASYDDAPHVVPPSEDALSTGPALSALRLPGQLYIVIEAATNERSYPLQEILIASADLDQVNDFVLKHIKNINGMGVQCHPTHYATAAGQTLFGFTVVSQCIDAHGQFVDMIYQVRAETIEDRRLEDAAQDEEALQALQWSITPPSTPIYIVIVTTKYPASNKNVPSWRFHGWFAEEEDASEVTLTVGDDRSQHRSLYIYADGSMLNLMVYDGHIAPCYVWVTSIKLHLQEMM